jgi:hypothetical protein
MVQLLTFLFSKLPVASLLHRHIEQLLFLNSYKTIRGQFIFCKNMLPLGHFTPLLVLLPAGMMI